ncbi:MAG: ABC transporter permease [Sandaracinaceae bacterium]|nr:ABC transporter permease [Sandaracinaceae bacterium]
MGVRSLSIVVVTALFVGAIMVIQAAPLVTRFNAREIVGWGAGFATLREVGPLLIALMFSGRVGANNTAELGTMVVTSQIDALRALAIDPLGYLVLPRVIAMVTMLFALTVIGDMVAIGGACLAGKVLLDVDPRSFMNSLLLLLNEWDLLTGLIKSVVFGIMIALTSCHFGLSVKGAPPASGAPSTPRWSRPRAASSSSTTSRPMSSADHAAPAPAAAPRARLLEALGGSVVEVARDVRALLAMFVTTVRIAARGKLERRLVVEQMHVIGNRSVFFVSVTMGFIGMILVFQSALQAMRIVPDLTLLGATYTELLVRDLAASIGAMMLATRVGAGIAAEIGSMVVTEQVDALRMCAADPIEYLVVPRFIASVVMTFCLLIWGGFVAFFAGMLTAERGLRRELPDLRQLHAGRCRRRHRRPDQVPRLRRRHPRRERAARPPRPSAAPRGSAGRPPAPS